MTSPVVVPIGITPLSDIPARLRKLADEIEQSNEFESISIAAVNRDQSVTTFGFGEYKGRFSMAGIFLTAAHLFVECE